ncbi:MAG: RecX family transcriptional regulator [Saprospiraceae bacterium]|nr:RecX family transcriptional regulator [Saprospiraceae bacterium]MBK9631145.1 RecX family transcriptional regulator [Saprospiraceae bacterium]
MESKMPSGKDVFRDRLLKYCQFRDRCQQEFEQKMWEIKIPREWQDELMMEFLQNDLLNEERFAKSMARGKFRINHWGKIKIKILLKSHRILDGLIREALNEIDDQEYFQTCLQEYKKKYETLTGLSEAEKKQKCIGFLLQKGFEYELIQKVMEGEN